jgi:(2R)-ethylmalonyl-CoA mutase
VIGELRARGAGDVPVVIGGVVPARDCAELERIGIRRVFTPSDYKLTEIVGALIDLCEPFLCKSRTAP